jgi:cyclophilin family peptidyl-prolyl cis-trans isomerase
MLTKILTGILRLTTVAQLIVACAIAAPEQDPPFSMPDINELSKISSAIITTSRGELVFDLFPVQSPMHVANFKYLADKGFYNGSKFHLFMPDYIIQGGDPSGTGKGGPGYSIPPEFNQLRHQFGSLGMARRSDAKNTERRSNGSQFHILLRSAPHMDGQYVIFGQLIKGRAVLESLRKEDVIEKVAVYVRE